MILSALPPALSPAYSRRARTADLFLTHGNIVDPVVGRSGVGLIGEQAELQEVERHGIPVAGLPGDRQFELCVFTVQMWASGTCSARNRTARVVDFDFPAQP